MPTPLRSPLLLIVLAIVASGMDLSARQAGQPLPIGKSDAGQASNDTSAAYRFTAATPGVLTVTVQGNGDLALRVVDEDDQTLPDGTSDQDRYGSVGTESLMVTITEPGTYRVLVRMQDSGVSKFQIGAAWIPFPSLAQPSDPDRRPAQARAVDVGKSYEDSLAANAGDRVDWYTFAPAAAGTFTVILRPVGESSVDLMLEVFLTADFTKPAARSDDDLQGNSANESATLDVTAGQKVLVRVSGATSSATGKYRISSSLIP